MASIPPWWVGLDRRRRQLHPLGGNEMHGACYAVDDAQEASDDDADLVLADAPSLRLPELVVGQGDLQLQTQDFDEVLACLVDVEPYHLDLSISKIAKLWTSLTSKACAVYTP